MRKTLRCAVLTGPTSDISAIAKSVIHLFTAGSQGHQNTVLLLLEDECIQQNLQDAIMKEITDRNITTHMPVVIILNCLRKAVIKQEGLNNSRRVILRTELSEAEKQQFEEKQIEISRSYSNEHKQFHGFNIMRENFSGDYVKETCAFLDVRNKRGPKNSHLLAFLSLVNAYVPGSHLLQSQCQAFLGPPDPIYGGPSFEQRMEPFTHLIVTFPTRQGQDKHVRMAHPLIAQQCVEFLATAGVTRSDTLRDFVIDFCGEEVQEHLMPVIKDMLTKREITVDDQQNTGQERQDPFSKPFFGEDMLMKREMGEERKDKFFRLIQDIGVYKNHLKSRIHDPSISAQEILQLSEKAFEAFKDEERAAENEQGADMQGDGMTKVSSIFNNRGLFGYLQVANIVFDSLVSLEKIWEKVLTMEVSADSFFITTGQEKLSKYKPLIISLRDEVERKCEFFDSYLTYSKPSIEENEPHYFQTDVKNCYCKYVGTCTPIHSESVIGVPLQKLKEEMAIAFPGLLSCLDKGYDESNLSRITKLRILERHLLANFGNQTPEFYLLVLLLFWPEEHKKTGFNIDLNKRVLEMQDSYSNTYKKHLRSRACEKLHNMCQCDGRYECRVSGLRWVCKTHVNLKYQFSSWEPHRAMVKSLGYKQGGPLLDVTVIAGKLEEVHLPHFACFGDDPSFKKKVRVLHVEDCGVSVEQVDEVTRCHVKILHPTFSPKGVLAMKKKEQSYGYWSIRKPQPVKSLGMKDWFSLTTSSPSAEVKPPKMNTTPNFFEVFIEDADVDFGMKLISDVEGEIVWDHTIRRADYRDERTQNSQSKHFVDLHRTDLIDRVSQVDPILDRLLKSGVISANGYSDVRSERTKQKKMRELFDGPLTGCGPKGKDIFLEILKEQEPFLIRELKGE
eukprot:XP_014011959.1 PREDICTED: sterile alpha motif domain-containing protein 9-like [Salmo salar]